MPVVHYEVHVTEHPEQAEILREPNLEEALRDAEVRHGTVIEVVDYDE